MNLHSESVLIFVRLIRYIRYFLLFKSNERQTITFTHRWFHYLLFQLLDYEYYSFSAPRALYRLIWVFQLHFLFWQSLLPAGEKVVGLVPLYRQGGNGVFRKWTDYNTKLCDGALNNLICVVLILRYNRFLFPPVKLN